MVFWTLRATFGPFSGRRLDIFDRGGGIPFEWGVQKCSAAGRDVGVHGALVAVFIGFDGPEIFLM